MTIEELKAERKAIEQEFSARLNKLAQRSGCHSLDVTVRTLAVGLAPGRRAISEVVVTIELKI